MKRPAFQFYPGDWQRDSALRSCSVGARGLWFEMLCIAHQAEPYGYVSVNGTAIHRVQLARMVGAAPREVAHWLDELKAAGVYSVDADGTIYSRRMVRDERLRIVRADAGRLGGNPALLKPGDNPEVNQAAKQNPTPSSSSSSSKPGGNGQRKPRDQRRTTPCPDEFEVSAAMVQWAITDLGLSEAKVRRETDQFLEHHRANGNRFVDWSAAWRKWMHKAVDYARH